MQLDAQYIIFNNRGRKFKAFSLAIYLKGKLIMIETLIDSFYDVMYKYRKHFSEHGVRANLERWLEMKTPLISILRNHPNWNETELAVVFDVVESRDINPEEVNTNRAALIQLAHSNISNESDFQNFYDAICAATAEYSKSPSEANIEIIKEKGNIPCVSGQKTSRIIGKLCRQFKVNTYSEYEKIFAQLSDALNPISQKKKALLSVHPCDYLEMSSKSNSWTSCHCLENGGWQAGCLSYMTDSDTLMFYTVDKDIVSDYHKAPRRTRQVFCYNNGVLLQSRLYPNSDETIIKKNREIVQDTISTCLEVANKWIKVKTDSKASYYKTVEGSKHYEDYTRNHFSVVSVLKNRETNEFSGSHEKLQIGSRPICVCCGRKCCDSGSIKCQCEEQIVCKDCGLTKPVRASSYSDDAWYCKSCLHICFHCGHHNRENSIKTFDGCGNNIEVCSNCYENTRAVCQTCSINSICSELLCNRFCQRGATIVDANV